MLTKRYCMNHDDDAHDDDSSMFVDDKRFKLFADCPFPITSVA